MRMSPAFWGCPDCGGSEAWVLCGGGLMCADDDCGTAFAGIEAWVAGRDAAADPEWSAEITLP